MISRQELTDVGRALGVSPQVVEKDYVLGWMLAGIFNNAALAPKWVFKGGTCLKKCFFETYRFSEDLDFSVTDPDHLTESFLRSTLAEVGQWIYDTSGIEVPIDSFVFKVKAGGRYIEGRIGYVGPFGRGSTTPKVKLDLTGDELLALEPVERPVYHRRHSSHGSRKTQRSKNQRHIPRQAQAHPRRSGCRRRGPLGWPPAVRPRSAMARPEGHGSSSKSAWPRPTASA